MLISRLKHFGWTDNLEALIGILGSSEAGEDAIIAVEVDLLIGNYLAVSFARTPDRKALNPVSTPSNFVRDSVVAKESREVCFAAHSRRL